MELYNSFKYHCKKGINDVLMDPLTGSFVLQIYWKTVMINNMVVKQSLLVILDHLRCYQRRFQDLSSKRRERSWE